MTGTMWAFFLLGILALVPALFVGLRRLTAAKQEQLSPDEFQRWFQKAYLGLEVDPAAEAGRAEASNELKGSLPAAVKAGSEVEMLR